MRASRACRNAVVVSFVGIFMLGAPIAGAEAQQPSSMRDSEKCLRACATSHERNDYAAFLRCSLLAQVAKCAQGEDAAKVLFENGRANQEVMGGKLEETRYIRSIPSYPVQRLGGCKTRADEYRVVTESGMGRAEFNVQMIMVTEAMKRIFPWLSANTGDWVFEDLEESFQLAEFLVGSLGSGACVAEGCHEEPSAPREQAALKVLAFYASYVDGKPRKVFRIGESFSACVVVLNTSGKQGLTIPAKSVHFVLTGKNGKQIGEGTAPVQDQTLEPGARTVVRCPLIARAVSWSQSLANGRIYNLKGEKATITVSMNKAVLGQTACYLDEYGVPDWLSESNGIVLNGLGASHDPPFDLFDPEKWDDFLGQVKESGMDVVFIGPEYYNYGYLEGGLSYGECPGVCPEDWKRKCAEPYLHYWFPTGPAKAATAFDYTTPHRLMRSASNAVTSVADQRSRIQEFVRRAHDKKYGLKVVGYMDFMGIYDPEQQVTDFESEHSVPEGSSKSYYETTVAWLPGGAVKRLVFSENLLDLNDPDLAESPWLVRYIRLPLSARDLNPDDYAIMPSLAGAANESSEPWDAKLDGTKATSYKDYIAQQVAWVMENYKLDGLLLDDVGRIGANLKDVTVPINCPGWSQPCAQAGCEGVRKTAERLGWSNDGFNNFMPPGFDQNANVFGCKPSESDYAHGESDDDVRKTMSSFLRLLRHQIRRYGPGDAVLISSDYFVPSDEVAASEDASSSDQHRIGSEYNARWCYFTREKAWKPLRLDYNPRTPADDDNHKLLVPAIAWANGSTFWFGGDATTINVPDLLTKKSLTSSRFATYAQFYRAYKIYLAASGADLIYHSQGLSFGESRANLPGGVRVTGDLSKPFVTMWTIPGEIGEQRRVIHVINSEKPGTGASVHVAVDVPPYEKVKSVQVLSPDTAPQEQTLTEGHGGKTTAGQWGPSGKSDGGGIGEVTNISLPSVLMYSIVVIEYESEAAEVGGEEPPVAPTSDVRVPRLIIPAEGATMDNGCYDRSDDEVWDFYWFDCLGADSYHLYVRHTGSPIPIIDIATLTTSSYHRESHGGYIAESNRFDWRWKVRARVNGIWGEWSEERSFNVEPLDTDCR